MMPSVTTLFSIEIMSTLKAIKSHFKQSYDKQNLTQVVISYGHQVLQGGRLNQAAVHNLDMHMCFQIKFWGWYNTIMKTTFHIMEIT